MLPQPTFEPTPGPTDEPTFRPSLETTDEPTFKPSLEPTLKPSPEPTDKATVDPTGDASVEPSTVPSSPTGNPMMPPTPCPSTLEPTPGVTALTWRPTTTAPTMVLRTTGPPQPTPEARCQGELAGGVDVYIAMDASGSIADIPNGWAQEVTAAGTLVRGVANVTTGPYRAGWGRWGTRGEAIKDLGPVTVQDITTLEGLPYEFFGDTGAVFALDLCGDALLTMATTTTTVKSCFVFTDGAFNDLETTYTRETSSLCNVTLGASSTDSCTVRSMSSFLKSQGVDLHVVVIGIPSLEFLVTLYELSSCSSGVVDPTCPYITTEPSFEALLMFFGAVDFEGVTCGTLRPVPSPGPSSQPTATFAPTPTT